MMMGLENLVSRRSVSCHLVHCDPPSLLISLPPRHPGYEFQGDQKLLGATFPALTARPNNFLDLRHVRMARSAPAPVAPGEAIDTKKKWRAKREKVKRDAAEEGERMGGGLGGLVTWFLGARLDKRQQLSDWEKRPLREEQVIYAGKW